MDSPAATFVPLLIQDDIANPGEALSVRLRDNVNDEFDPSTVEVYTPPKLFSASTAACPVKEGIIEFVIRSAMAETTLNREVDELAARTLKPMS